MVVTVRLILLVLAFLLFLLEGFGVVAPRVKLGWLGLACLTLAIWLLPVHA